MSHLVEYCPREPVSFRRKAMDYEQEEGRRISATVRRKQALAFAESLVSWFKLAREELGSDPTVRAYAAWLNRHNVKARRGGSWGAEQVNRVLDIASFQRIDANAIYAHAEDIQLTRREWAEDAGDLDRIAAVDARIAELAIERDEAIQHAEAVAKGLRGY